MAGVDMSVTLNDCWVVGLERFAVGPAGEKEEEEEEEFYEIRTEWSDKSITYHRRRYHDLVKLVKNLSKSCPDDRGCLSQMLEALQRIKEAEEKNNVETRLDEVEKLLRNIIKKFSQSEAVLTFFKTSPLDYTLKTMYAPIQSFYQSPVTVADVRRANGFCLANTETVLFDAYLLAEGASSSSESQIWTGTRIQNGIGCTDEPGEGFMTPGTTESKDTDYQPNKSQITTSNLTYLHLQACETDILE